MVRPCFSTAVLTCCGFGFLESSMVLSMEFGNWDTDWSSGTAALGCFLGIADQGHFWASAEEAFPVVTLREREARAGSTVGSSWPSAISRRGIVGHSP